MQWWLDHKLITEDQAARMFVPSGELLAGQVCKRLARPLHWMQHVEEYKDPSANMAAYEWWNLHRDWASGLEQLQELRCAGPMAKLTNGTMITRTEAEAGTGEWETPYYASPIDVCAVTEFMLTVREAMIIK